MHRRMGFVGIAAIVALGAGTAVAQQAGAQQAGAPARADAKATDKVSVVGCVELESDFRKRMGGGRGGVLGTGVGASDEFVLTNIRPRDAAVGTTGSESRVGGGGGVYTLTGPHEAELVRSIGRQIEVVGTIENAGKPETGAELDDISTLPRIDIETWHPVSDFCPAK